MGGFLVNPNLLATEGFFGGGASGGGGFTFNILSIGVGSTGPSFNGPGQSYYGGASTGAGATPSGFSGGSLSPDPMFINGVQISAFGQMSTSPVNIPPTGNAFVMILSAPGLPQNFFTSLDFTLSDATVWHLLTSAAQFNNPWDDTATGIGFTTWVWPNGEPFFPPPTWPTPIVGT